MLANRAVGIIIFALLTSSTCQGQQVGTELLIKSGEDFSRTCTVSMGSGLNVTCTLPSSGGGSPNTDTATQRHNNEAALFLRKLSNLKDRLTMTYHSDPILQVITATMTIRNASYLDTGYYGCRLNNSASKFNDTYIFVHPSNISHDETGVSVDDLLLPTLDVYVFEEGNANQFYLPFKPTHPDVQLELSRRNNKQHWIEIFSTLYNGSENDIWTWNKHHGLTAVGAKTNQTKGVYWCDATLNGRTTTRYFRIFVTSSRDHSQLNQNRPHIKNAVEYLIFPSGSSFVLKCHIEIDELRNYNITWMVPKPLLNQNYSVVWETSENLRSATLKVSDIRFLYTGNYTCHRNDAHHLFANQYIFVSDAENLLLPIDRSFIFNETQRAVLPCRPTHPDVSVSLKIEGTSGRGKENITLYPLNDERGKSGDWLYSKFQGFRTKKNASRATAGRNYLCKGSRFRKENNRLIEVIVADIKLYVISDPSNQAAIVHGDDVTLRCDTHQAPSSITWHPPNGQSQMIAIDSQEHPAGISKVYQTPNRVHQRLQQRVYATELRWERIDNSATGFYECRYNDSSRRNVAVQFYHMIVQEAQAPRLAPKQLNKKKRDTIIVMVKEGKDAQLECHLEEGAPLPTVSWFKYNDLLDKMTPENGLTFNETKINGTFHFYLHLTNTERIHQGEYTCHFENRLGSDNQTFHVKIEDNESDGATMAVIVVLVIIIILLMMVARFFYVRFSSHRSRNAADIAKVLGPLLAGNPERLNRKLPLDGQSELLPYDNSWEFPRERLKIGKQLGAGCFGRVLKGQAEGIIPGEEVKTETVAIKMVRSYADLSALASLVSELKILIHLGSHLNIVNLLGACTDVANGDFLVIVEYCHFGNLLNHLLANRHCYMDQVNENGELAQLDSFQDLSSGNGDYLYMGSPALAPAPIPVKSERKRSRKETRETDYLAMLLTNHGSVSFSRTPRPPQGQSNDVECADDQTNHPFSTRDLACWAFQIARGMDYLSGRNVIHGDLAARNVLLAANGVVKIADFGLSRKVYQDSNYKKKGEGMLPVKWMAIESLTDRIFSSQSDVWAFGITMWEMFSLGKAPYPDMEDIGGLIQHLEGGGRMVMPRNAPNGVAEIISKCWKADPNVRPTFAQLEHMLGDWVEESIRTNYVEMNEPYSRRNAERFGNLVDEFMSQESSANQQQQPTTGYVNVQEDRLPAMDISRIVINHISPPNRHFSASSQLPFGLSPDNLTIRFTSQENQSENETSSSNIQPVK